MENSVSLYSDVFSNFFFLFFSFNRESLRYEKKNESLLFIYLNFKRSFESETERLCWHFEEKKRISIIRHLKSLMLMCIENVIG